MSSLLLQEQGPEAEGEVGGVGVDQDAEAQGDAGQTAGPRLGKQFVFFNRTKLLMQICIATVDTQPRRGWMYLKPIGKGLTAAPSKAVSWKQR